MREFYEVYLSCPKWTPEAVLRQAIKQLRTISKRKLEKKYNIKLNKNEKYPFVSPEHWSPWVCYSKEKME